MIKKLFLILLLSNAIQAQTYSYVTGRVTDFFGIPKSIYIGAVTNCRGREKQTTISNSFGWYIIRVDTECVNVSIVPVSKKWNITPSSYDYFFTVPETTIFFKNNFTVE